MILFAATVALFPHSFGAKLEPITAKNYIRLLSPGINLGNTLEAIPTATSWGNPEPTQELMNGYRAAGFRSIRIPVAWSQYTNNNNTIDSKWMNQVADTVQMAHKAGLYVLLNIHWDGGWLQPLYTMRAETEAKFMKFWMQIANHFKNTDDWLMFAGTNEVHVEGNYGAPSIENAEVQNGFNQIFVNTVRSVGGKNRDRWLVVQSYNTDIDHGIKNNVKMPGDTVKGKLMMEVHYYSPYNFTLNEKSDIWQWGAQATDKTATDTWGNEDFVDAQFQKMKSGFVNKGIPVLLGEYGTGRKPNFPGMDKYRALWTNYVTKSAIKHGLVPMYWDTGTADGVINRLTGKPQNTNLLGAIQKAVK